MPGFDLNKFIGELRAAALPVNLGHCARHERPSPAGSASWEREPF